MARQQARLPARYPDTLLFHSLTRTWGGGGDSSGCLDARPAGPTAPLDELGRLPDDPRRRVDGAADVRVARCAPCEYLLYAPCCSGDVLVVRAISGWRRGTFAAIEMLEALGSSPRLFAPVNEVRWRPRAQLRFHFLDLGSLACCRWLIPFACRAPGSLHHRFPVLRHGVFCFGLGGPVRSGV